MCSSTTQGIMNWDQSRRYRKCAMDITTYFEPLLTHVISHERWVSQMNTNLFGPMNMSRAILPYFRQKKEGKLVFIGSVNGWHGATASAPYTASKFALEGLNICAFIPFMTDTREQATLNVSRRNFFPLVYSLLSSSQEAFRRNFCLLLKYRALQPHMMSIRNSLP